ncbi:cullin-like protein, partial [Trifolium medium]|nr:cullin-like protein [Trifolium medium]
MKAKIYDEDEAKKEEEVVVLKNPQMQGKSRAEMGLKDFKGVEIRSTVAGLDITITKAHFVKLLKLKDQGKVISKYKKNEHYRKAIKRNMFIIKEDVGKSKSMNDNCKVLFKILISSILPRGSGVDTISWEHKHF